MSEKLERKRDLSHQQRKLFESCGIQALDSIAFLARGYNHNVFTHLSPEGKQEVIKVPRAFKSAGVVHLQKTNNSMRTLLQKLLANMLHQQKC
ncbi:MAG TPA: hypothetical protein VLB73_02075 [Patescibacteria group bacterium]|nr:hypothetical protein [Patescibacteria group bacterium]